MPGNWIEIKARGRGETRDEAALLLMEAGSPGVVEEEFLAKEGVWEVPEDEGKASLSTLTGYIPEDRKVGLAPLRKKLKASGWSFTVTRYRDRDWSVKWREGYSPQRICYRRWRIVVKAPWHSVEKRKGDTVLLITPSMAFGTGRHPTTRMCLKALLMLVKEKKVLQNSFLDVGTGSGILAIAAKKLGFRKSIGIDIDRTALTVARKNARLNRTGVVISSKTPGDVPGVFSAVTANITSGELKRLRHSLEARVSQGGVLILSGLLREEVPPVAGLFASGRDFRLSKKYLSGEWGTVVLEKREGKDR